MRGPCMPGYKRSLHFKVQQGLACGGVLIQKVTDMRCLSGDHQLQKAQHMQAHIVGGTGQTASATHLLLHC